MFICYVNMLGVFLTSVLITCFWPLYLIADVLLLVENFINIGKLYIYIYCYYLLIIVIFNIYDVNIDIWIHFVFLDTSCVNKISQI